MMASGNLNIVHILPGTGGMVCGSCIRDVALVRELKRRGHDTALVPLYLPLFTEQGDPSDTPIFFGGINVYLQQKFRWFRHAPGWLDRLLDRPSLLRMASRGGQMTSPRDLGELTLSMLRGQEGNQVKEIDKLISWLESQPRPDVVCLSNGLLIGLAGALKERLGCAVVCTLQGEDTFLDSLPQPYADQAWAELRAQAVHVDLFVPVSRFYGSVMQERLKLEDARFQVVENGIDLAGFSMRAALPSPPVVGYLARMSPEKGLEVLVDAYLMIRRENRVPGLRLHVAGGRMSGDVSFVAKLEQRIKDAGYSGEVLFRPNLEREEKQAFLQGLTLLSVPAIYGEAFGLYLLEAMASGVPVVQPRHAAFPEIIAGTGGGRLYEPNSAEALADAWTELLRQPEEIEALGRAGRTAVENHFSVAAMADRVLEGYTKAIALAGNEA
ncbi:MAG: glycosyltransferase family 4 protein [Verrucomicrobiota bacterium]|jgi:glycosyltransferase involved in cell wall biosynthesis|nr:glycosyltransferase family 4 protein [Verrucomicrobiota bacterium]